VTGIDHHAIEAPEIVVVSPQMIAGSPRRKAGTAQKLVPNDLDGLYGEAHRAFGDPMVDVVAGQRGAARARPPRGHPGDVRVAIVWILAQTDAATRVGLEAVGGGGRRALEQA